MQTGLFTYSGIITKMKAMQSNLFSERDYEQIINMGSVAEIISFLREHEAYKEIFQNLDINIHRGQIEHELIHSLQMTYAKLHRFAKIEQRRALQLSFYLFEIKILKKVLQGIVRGENELDLSLFEDFFKKHSVLDIIKLNTADTIGVFIEDLKGTEYYDVLKEVESIPEPTLFDYETRLDVFYFEKMWKAKDEVLKGKEKKEFTDIIGTQIDLLNLTWIYRFKTYFDTDNGKIMQSIIPIHYKLSKKQTAAMVATENVSDLIELIQKSHYRRLFPKETITKQELEERYRRQVDKVYRNHAKQSSMSIIPIFSFLHQKERELDKITTALECVRYGLTPEKSTKILERL